MLCEFVTTFVPSPVLFTFHKGWVDPFLQSCFHHMEVNAKPTLELTERNCGQSAPISCVKWNIFLFFEKEILTLHANFFGSALNVDPSRIYAMLPVLHLMIFLSSWIHSKFAAKCTIIVFINLWKLLLVNWWCCCAGVCGLCNGRILKLVLPED